MADGARAATVAPAPPDLDRARTHTDGSDRDTDTAPVAPAATSSSKLPYFPGLDGLRGVAVIAVLFFHGGFSWAVGGYLGVSTFFTLSGFLITSLLLAERTTTRTVNLRAFWGRRLRRLMPASLAALVVVLAFGVLAAGAVQQRNLGGDVTAALLYVANWRFIISGPVLRRPVRGTVAGAALLEPRHRGAVLPLLPADRLRAAGAAQVGPVEVRSGPDGAHGGVARLHPLPRLLPRPHLLRHRHPGLRAAGRRRPRRR